ncbi:MAG: GNAT family N-acetyltransferase [Anaerolineae bacterium]|nr:GNAT family N-acetyltransferase [Anaerolineae bacterium]
MSEPCIDLCGLWRFQPDPSNEGERAAYALPDYDDLDWREVRLPNGFEACGPGLEHYEGTGWFRRSLIVPSGWRGQRVLLRFQGVNDHAKVWINGQAVGEHLDGFLPFAFAVQDIVRWGEMNHIAVRVDNVRRRGEVPGLQRGWRTFGGILREVDLVATDFLYLDQVVIAAEPQQGGGSCVIRADLKNERRSQVEADLDIEMSNSAGETVAQLKSETVVLEPDTSTTIALENHIPGAQPWSPAAPNLYWAEVVLRLDGTVVDRQTIRFGFRTIRVCDDTLLLNGEPIYLTGFNRHEDSPHTNMATDLETVRQDLVEMKAAGANFVRLCHYPHHPRELDLCDELGLLAMDEIPLYWWDGNQEGQEKCEAKLAAARRQLDNLIRRDINHPALIFWSVSNETREEQPEVAEGNRRLVRFARERDPTRLAVHVSDRWQQHPHFDQDDVICVNSYPSLDRRGFKGDITYDWSESTRIWREGLQTLHEQYPRKPILVTEFGYASFEGVSGGAFGQDVQAQAIAHEFASMDAPYVCGATIWCWADHAWPPATFGYCYYLGTSPYGVVTRERRKLEAYWAVKKLFQEKQTTIELSRTTEPSRTIEPSPVASPQEGVAGYGVWMIRPDMSDIPQVPFPEGFGIRPMRLDDVGLWTDIERDAENYYTIGDDTFYHVFGADLQAIQWRCFIVTNPKGAGVGTISAWYDRHFKNQEYGRIHWVAIRPAYQGKGLGKAALSFALNQLARWHDRCYLDTQTRRLPAITMYLRFGFVPDMSVPGAQEGWRHTREAGLVF